MNWLDILVAIIIIASFVRGFKTGLVMQVASLAGIILGAIFAGKIAEIIYPHMLGIIGNSENITGPLSYLIGFVVILVAVNLIGRIINSVVKVAFLGTINRIIGAAFCMGKWILIVSILLNLLVQFDQTKSIVKEKVREESHTYPVLTNIAQTVIPYLRFENFKSSTSPKQDNPQLQSVSLLEPNLPPVQVLYHPCKL